MLLKHSIGLIIVSFFLLLLKRDLPACVIRVLINCYVSNYARVTWNEVFSAYFLVKNGVKQGGVLSPVMFCVYIDDLLVQLARIGVGCFIRRKFVGALAYADDIVLVAPTASALCKMLAVCDNYATEYYMAFNAHKSKCMALLPSVCVDILHAG